MPQGFIEKTELAIGDIPVPYYCITLTAEQAKLIEYREIEIARIDGRTLFPVKKDGKETGEFAMYILFKP